MPRLSYRRRLMLRKLLRVLGIVLAAAIVIGAALLLYLEPYVTYDRDGAHLSLKKNAQDPDDTGAAALPEVSDAQIVYDEAQPGSDRIADLGGVYVTTQMLRDPEAVRAALEQQGACAVLLQLKSTFGNFYYSSAVSGASVADGDITACDELLSYLSSKGFYMVAALPTFSDPNFALQNQSSGLPIAGGALWMDENGCYWLNPADSLTQNYLLEIFADLKRVGFREVALRDFRYPDSDSIVYPDGTDKAANLSALQATLDSFCARNELTLSYVTDATEFSLGGGTGRIYIPNADATKIELYKQAYAESGASELVFLSSSSDTRFDGTAVLRPLPLVSADDADASEPTDATDASEPTDATEPDTTDGGGFVGG